MLRIFFGFFLNFISENHLKKPFFPSTDKKTQKISPTLICAIKITIFSMVIFIAQINFDKTAALPYYTAFKFAPCGAILNLRR